ncbi:MAG: protein kinase [Chloroflexi bacterium]|nr:protein kinase [Chloroflexota bacterium]
MNAQLGGRYTLLGEIGSGGLARVFQAVDAETGRPVAAKVLTQSAVGDPAILLRFRQEALVAATLRHPNIVEVYTALLEQDVVSIIMEYVEGQSLEQILRSQGRLPLRRIGHLAQQVLSALAYAHERGILHRDVKPGNVLGADANHAKLTDFGVAGSLGGGDGLHTQAGTTMSTPLYMAPEQIEGERVDGRADLYAVGVVLYQVVTGLLPFEGSDPLTVAFRQVHKAPRPPREVDATVPAGWEALILKALAKDPGERFQTAREMLDALSALAGVEAPARRCPACDASLRATARFCTECGSPVAAPQAPQISAPPPSATQAMPMAAPPPPGVQAPAAPGRPRRRTMDMLDRIRRRK